MNKVERQITEAINSWASAAFRGIGTIVVPKSIDARGIVLNVLQRFYIKNPDANVLVLTDTFEDRGVIVEYLTHTEHEQNNEAFSRLLKSKRLMVASANVYDRCMHFPTNKLVIVYNPTCYDSRHKNLLSMARFKLCVLGKPFTDSKQHYELIHTIPIVDSIDINAVNELRTTSPVEEMYVPVLIPPNSDDEYIFNRFNKFVREAMSIFGDLATVSRAINGDRTLNKSALDVCKDLAYANGWSENLDMTVQFNVDIDEHFNPITIKELADSTYNVIRERNVFLSNYVGKLSVIKDIINNHKDEKILVISKRGQFAAKITDYLNVNAAEEICGDYHLNVEPRQAVDEFGNPILIKSGTKKGTYKMLGAQAQSTLNEKKFNAGRIHVLSTSNAPNKDLTIDVDVVIITSPQCEDVHAFMYRLSNVNFNRNKLKLYSLYVKSTSEEQRLANKEIKDNHIIVNREEIIKGNANNFDFVIAD